MTFAQMSAGSLSLLFLGEVKTLFVQVDIARLVRRAMQST